MQFGHFDDENKEYVITSPRTPLPWINYLGCEDFFSLQSIIPAPVNSRNSFTIAAVIAIFVSSN